MSWMEPTSLKRRGRKKRAHFGKSSSEPNLSGHFTPRFPDNLSHLLHEYVTVDELKFYRKRRPPNVGDEFHNKERICLYDQSQPIIPFAALKSEYTKEFGKSYSLRSRSVPNKIDLNATTKELLDSLRDDYIDSTPARPKRANTAKLSGEIEIEGIDDLLAKRTTNELKVNEKNETESKEQTSKENRRKCMFKVQGEVSYSVDLNGEFEGNMENSESISRLNNIKFHGKFHGTPEYRDNFKSYDNFTKSAPIKAGDHLRVSPVTVPNRTAVVSPNLSSLTEYIDKYKEIDLRSADRRKLSKQMSNVAMRNKLMIGHSDQHVFPEYFESFKDYHIKKPPEKPKPRSPILSLSGNMDYNPEYRVKFTEFPRRRPIVSKRESHFDFFEAPRKRSPIRPAIISPKFNPNIAVVEPSQNIHQPPITIDKNPFYLCQPEVRKARHEVLIKKRPPTPSQTISTAIRRNGPIGRINEDEDNQRYNEQSHIIQSPVKPPVQVIIDNYDEPSIKPIPLLSSAPVMSAAKYGRRVSVQTSNPNAINSYAKRNLSKIIEGNYEYTRKKSSLTSSTDDEHGNHTRKLLSSQSAETPSFVVLNDAVQQNQWMKSSWYS